MGDSLQIHDVAEYITWNIPRPTFFIQDILPKEQGTLLLYGDPKVKKSWLVEQMGMCISQGIDWLGFGTEQARVLIAQFEIGTYTYHWRLKDMALRHFSLQEHTLFELTQPRMYLENNETFAYFTAGLRDLAFDVIIMDCLSACFGGDENDSEQVAGFIEKMVSIQTEHNASLVLVHHANKNQLGGNSVNRARGHSRLTGWVDTLIHMVEQPTGVQLQFSSRQATRELHSLNIDFNDYLWTRRT